MERIKIKLCCFDTVINKVIQSRDSVNNEPLSNVSRVDAPQLINTAVLFVVTADFWMIYPFSNCDGRHLSYVRV